MDHRPNESMPHYEQAASLAPKAENATLCQFKLRLARLEAGDVNMAAEIEARKNAGDLSIDWLMTEAALNLRGGHLEEALPLIEKARATDPTVLRRLRQRSVLRLRGEQERTTRGRLEIGGPRFA